jgi:hypothetical protein
MIDRKQKIVETLEKKLALMTIASGYDYDLQVFKGYDWLMSDQLDYANLPACCVSSEGIEEYSPTGNMPHTVSTEIPVYIWMKKELTVGGNRIEARKMIMNIKSALQCCDIEMELKRNNYAENFYLARIETDTGWSGNYIIIMVLYKAEYDEEDEWVV